MLVPASVIYHVSFCIKSVKAAFDKCFDVVVGHVMMFDAQVSNDAT